MKEILKTILDKSVESSLGWRVDILSLARFRYTEQGKTIDLILEDRPSVGGELEWIIYLPEKWVLKDNLEEELVLPERIPEILNRISLAFWKLDMPIKEMV